MSDLPLTMLLSATLETLYMIGIAGALATLFGIPLGIILMTTRAQGLFAFPLLNTLLGILVNVTRSIPFIILMIFLIPLSRAIVGTSIGTTAAIVPLTLGAIPFVARLAETALLEIPAGLIETGKAMGASPLQIILRILLPEALPSLIQGITLTLIALVGYSAMAGAIGGGGLGNLAINYGYQRFEITVMLMTLVVLIALVQLIQWLGDYCHSRATHR